MDETSELETAGYRKGAPPVIEMLFNLCLCGSPMSNIASQQTGLRLHQLEVVSTISMHLRTAIVHEGITTTEMEALCQSDERVN